MDHIDMSLEIVFTSTILLSFMGRMKLLTTTPEQSACYKLMMLTMYMLWYFLRVIV